MPRLGRWWTVSGGKWREVKWTTLALVALPLVCGTVLSAMGREPGRELLSVALGMLAGLPLSWRRGDGPPSIPPGASVLLVALATSLALGGCGGSSPPPSVCAVARAAREPCAVVEAYAARCDADGGVP